MNEFHLLARLGGYCKVMVFSPFKFEISYYQPTKVHGRGGGVMQITHAAPLEIGSGTPSGHTYPEAGHTKLEQWPTSMETIV